MFSEKLLRAMWPQGDSKVPGLVAAIAADATTVFAAHGMNTPIVVAHAMAQFTHECGGGAHMVESIEYTPQRACEVWPSRFSSVQDCLDKVGSFAGDPDFKFKLINQVYGGRNGNTAPDDGSKYIGRGLAQVTGKGNYKRLGDQVGLDLVGDPNLVIAADKALDCGAAEFVLNGCLPFAQLDDLLAVSSMLNVGHRVTDPSKVVGFAERKAALQLWKYVLGVEVPPHHSAAWAQVMLNNAGADPPLVPDGAFGNKSRTALKAFQTAHGLPADGQLNANTLAALDNVVPQA